MDRRETGSCHEIVIIGGGICGLATALALHRKGIQSVVLERAESLRTTGAAIGVLANGWRALHQLGVASNLRLTALPLQGARDIWIDKCKQQEMAFITGEARCLKRSDLIETLANALPPGTIHFGCRVESVNLDPRTNLPILRLCDGTAIVAKILIGCDGAKSVVADFLKLKPTKLFNLCAVRGLTNYPNGHSFAHKFIRMRKSNTLIGTIPINEELVYWFVGLQCSQIDTKISDHPELIKESTLEQINSLFPAETINMVQNSDLDSLSLTNLRYREPWALLLSRFRKGTITVAGDAMHVMGPFLGQGGSAGLEDAVVIARKLSPIMSLTKNREATMVQKIEVALDEYVKERRMRLLALSTQTYLAGILLGKSPWLLKLFAIIIMVIFFYNPSYHTKYDCGHL